jgi:hypothetical protein
LRRDCLADQQAAQQQAGQHDGPFHKRLLGGGMVDIEFRICLVEDESWPGAVSPVHQCFTNCALSPLAPG